MKKITSLLSLALIATAGFAQSNSVPTEIRTEPVNFNTSTNALVDCGQENLGALYAAWGPTDLPDLIWVDDLVIEAGESMNLTEIAIQTLGNPGVDFEEGHIFIYEDSGNGPGAELAVLEYVEVASQDVLGNLSGFDVKNVVFEIDPVYLAGQADEQTIYWVGIVMDSYLGTASYYGITTDVISNPAYVYDGDEGQWFEAYTVFEDYEPSDFLFTFSGDCTPLSVNDNVLTDISIYPNPATDILNIQTPANIIVESVSMFDILGKNVNVTFTNGTINTSALSKGVYILQVNTNQGTLTQKVVKQ